MRKLSVWTILLTSAAAAVPLRGADWLTHSGDNQRTAWQKDEKAITRDNVKGLQLLWKLKLDNQARSVYSLTAPLVVQRLITDRGFKELVYVAGSSDNLFAVDADLGKLFWKKHFEYQSDIPQQQSSSFLCPGGLTATPVIHPGPTFGRGRGAPSPGAPGAARGPGAAPAAPAPVAPAPVAPTPVAPGAARGAAPPPRRPPPLPDQVEAAIRLP